MRKATLEKVQARHGDYVDSSAKRPILIVRDGEPVAMLLGIHPKRRQTPAKLRAVLKNAWKDFEKHGGIAHEKFWKELASETRKT